MELAYNRKQSELEAKPFLAFQVVIFFGTLLNGVLTALWNGLETGDIIILVAQSLLPLIGLFIRNKMPNFSKLLTLSSLPLGFAEFRNMFDVYFRGQENITQKFFVFGNSLGLVEVALAVNLRRLRYKTILSLGFFVVKIATIHSGYFNLATMIGAVVAVLFVNLAFLHQEIQTRKDYKSIYESQESLRKFQSLLSDDFPIGVIVMTANFESMLYCNSYFQRKFEEEDLRISNNVFKRFEVDIDQSTFGTNLITPSAPIPLPDFLNKFTLYKLSTTNLDGLILSATYRNENNNNNSISHYEIKLRKTTWDGLPSYAMIFNDVSQKQMVTALKLADKQKDRIIATVSHELRTPINGTLGLLEMITERVSDELSQTYLKYCKACNKLLLYLVNSILDLSQLQQNTLQINKESFVLEELLEELRALYLYQCQMKGIKFVIEKGECVPKEIYTDRHRLIEILINLVGNAIKFTFKGSVTLKIELNKEDISKLKFSIIDTGIGIKDKDKDKLFKRFGKIQQDDAKVNAHGVGLGLAIVQDLILVLNENDCSEKIDFLSEYGKGSTFYFNLYHKKTVKVVSPKRTREFLTPGSVISPIAFEQNTESLDQKIRKYDFSLASSRSQGPLLENSHHKIGEKIKGLMEKIDQEQERQGNELDLDSIVIQPSRKNVLIVDDNPFNILAASHILGKFNFQIDKAFNGQECIDLIVEHNNNGKYYDLILMDIQMPVLDGPETSKMIMDKINNKELREVPIVALTAKKSTLEEEGYYETCGITAILEKPLNESKLVEIIKFYCEGYDNDSL